MDLAPFQGTWVEVTETITYGEWATGKYALHMSKVSDQSTLFSYSNDSIRTWKTNADFCRPKWGIYRSIVDSTSLKDEEVLFADFSIQEVKGPALSLEESPFSKNLWLYPNPLGEVLNLDKLVLRKYQQLMLYNQAGQVVLSKNLMENKIPVAHLKKGVYIAVLSGKGNLPVSMKILKK